MKYLIFLCVGMLFSIESYSQDSYITKSAYAKIYSTTVIEDIEAENFKVTSKINPTTGEFIVSVPVQSFKFEKAAMQKHFNQPNFMDSQKFPKIKFKGEIVDISKIDFSKDGKYKVTVKGDLTIRSVTKPITESGTIVIENGKVSSHSVFTVNNIYQYGVGKPKNKAKKDAVAENIKVTFKSKYN